MVAMAGTSEGRIVHTRQPLNSEPPLGRLCAAYLTPQTDLYVRCHGEIPALDEATHRLGVEGRVARPLDLSMAALRERFPARSVTAVLQCAGNRRGDLARLRPVTGDLWSAGAIGNAVWSGVALGDVLRAAGVWEGEDGHVVLSAADACEVDGERFRYEVSIPMAKALAPEVLLATGINGEPLTPEHGFPLRAIVPGFAGVRSAKWLRRIAVQAAPSEAKPQARDYKLFPPGQTSDSADWREGLTIDAMPLNAAICMPAEGAVVRPGPVTVRGYATASGRKVARVDVSADGGRHWRQARLAHEAGAPWGWALWELELELPGEGEHELVVRAWDSAAQTQPASAADVWNFKGYCGAAWHRVRIVSGGQGLGPAGQRR